MTREERLQPVAVPLHGLGHGTASLAVEMDYPHCLSPAMMRRRTAAALAAVGATQTTGAAAGGGANTTAQNDMGRSMNMNASLSRTHHHAATAR